MADELLPATMTTDAPEFADELDEAILVGVIADDAAFARWVPANVGQAEWAMRKLATLRGRARDVERQADAWREPIAEWESQELARVRPGIAFFDRAVVAYAIAQRDATKEATTLLPSGFIKTRRGKQPVIEVADDAVVVAWAGEHLSGDVYEVVIKATPKVLISELRPLVHAVETTIGMCDVCNAAIEERDGSWDHIVEQGGDDHAVVPQRGYKVVLTETGEVVPGLHVEPPRTTATVTVNR